MTNVKDDRAHCPPRILVGHSVLRPSRHERGASSHISEVRPLAPGVRLREGACIAHPWRMARSPSRHLAPVLVIQRP